MKLAQTMLARTLDQYDARVIPETDPATPKLAERFGNHTFFVDRNGLNIIEPTETNEPRHTGVVVNLASFNDDRSELVVHAPEVTDMIVALGPLDGT